MSEQVQRTVQVATLVPVEMAEELRRLAKASERSQAAEVRLALRAWVDAARLEQAQQAVS